MNHFMLVMDGYGIRPPAGEAYFAAEGANGELGFYVVSDGSDRPYRVRCRPPCLPPVAALPRMIEGRDGRRHHPDLRLRQHDRRASWTKNANQKDAKAPYRGHGSPCPLKKIERVALSRTICQAAECLTQTPNSRRPVAEVRPALPGQAGALLPVLRLAQEVFGYVSLEVEEYVAGLFEMSPAHVHEVVTFYTLFFQQPDGPARGLGLPQPLLPPARRQGHRRAPRGAAGRRGRARRRADGRVTLLTVECLCACEQAPMMQVDDRYEGLLTPEKVDRILDGLS